MLRTRHQDETGFFQYGHSTLTVINKMARMDSLDGLYGVNEHIWPSKYDTRPTVVFEVYHALDKLGICSICGYGASTIAKKLVMFVRREGLSQRDVAMVTVSQNPNLQNIREDILQQIRRRKIDNCLLIFDGFWWELENKDFQTIGIPSPSLKFRIVFVSRNEDMCKKIGRHQIHYVHFLEDEEALDLFRETAGKVDLAFTETARKIVDECDGLYIAILTVASALKDKPADVWEDSLKKLQNLNRKDSSDMEKVLSRIDLSYNLLNDKGAQLMFLICCLFPEDFNIPIENLVLFSKGLELFENVGSMNQARDRVECIVHKLKKAYFLLDGDGDDFVKVHDMLRDFGVSVSSNLEYPFVVRCENSMEEWPAEGTENQNCTVMSLLCKTIEQHPVDLKCPNLHLLQLSYGRDSARLPNGIFKGLQNLKVLSLSIPSLLQPLTVLKNLRTLCITESISDNRYITPRPRIGDLVGDEMKDLEIFSFSTARPCDDFPREIGLLHNLRFLSFNREGLKYIPPGVLSKLEKLEELYLPQDFISWGHKEEGGERMNASLSEIESLPLTAIRIGIPKGLILAEKFGERLTRFHMFIGSHVSPEYEFITGGNSKKSLEVFDVDADDFTMSWVSALAWKSESLRLKQVRNLQNIITCQPKEDGNNGLQQWKKICICDCKELEYLSAGGIPWACFSQLDSLKLFGLCNLKEIWNGLYLSKTEGSCFGNLCELQIMFCRKLKYVFSVPIATKLRQLQHLQICFCDEMEKIFYREQANDNGSQVEASSKEGGSASKGKTRLSDPALNRTVNTSIHHKSKLFSLTSNSLTKCLFGRGKEPKNIARQQEMEQNIGKEDEAKDAITFPQLKTMELAYLDKLSIFYDGNHCVSLPVLESLSIFRCNRLEAFCYGLTKTPLLEKMQFNGNQYSVTEDLNAFLKSSNRL